MWAGFPNHHRTPQTGDLANFSPNRTAKHAFRLQRPKHLTGAFLTSIRNMLDNGPPWSTFVRTMGNNKAERTSADNTVDCGPGIGTGCKCFGHQHPHPNPFELPDAQESWRRSTGARILADRNRQRLQPAPASGSGSGGVYFCSDAARYANGEATTIDGKD